MARDQNPARENFRRLAELKGWNVKVIAERAGLGGLPDRTLVLIHSAGMDQTLLEHVLDEEKWLRDRLAQVGRLKAKLLGQITTTRTPAIAMSAPATDSGAQSMTTTDALVA